MTESIEMMNLRQDEKIDHYIIEEVFDYEKPYFFDRYDEADEEMTALIGK